MNLYSIVKTKNRVGYHAGMIPSGTRGMIVEVYADGKACEVEFHDGITVTMDSTNVEVVEDHVGVLKDKIDGLESELYCLIAAIARRYNGDAEIETLYRFVEDNFPKAWAELTRRD